MGKKRSMISFHDLYADYSADVYRFSFWLSGNSQEAQDITSETFVRAWIHKDTLQLSTMKSYLFAIARNLFLQRKRNARCQVELDADFRDSGHGPDHQVEVQSELRALTRALQKLSDIDRTLLLMRAQEDLPYEDIARACDLSVSTVKVRIHRARLKLKLLRTRWEGQSHENHT